MRILSLLSVLLFVLGSCNSQKNGVGTIIEMKDIEIQYEANTRGFYQKLVIKNAEMVKKIQLFKKFLIPIGIL
jgi:hypothetical protein